MVMTDIESEKLPAGDSGIGVGGDHAGGGQSASTVLEQMGRFMTEMIGCGVDVDRQMKEEVEGVPGFLVRMVVDLLARWKAQDGRRKDDSGHFCEFLLLQLKI